MTKTVYVGLSGGVDSSVTAALLKDQGYNVVGVFMKNWSKDLPGFPCPWKEDYQDAKRVAVQIGIDFKLYDFETQYRQKVVDYMVSEYQAGRTPNPDIMCNQEVKFKLFLQSAIGDGADLIATGHYAKTKAGRLFVAANREKDQTYFLYRVNADALTKSLMPLGEFKSKADVRALAKKFGLVTADKKDSQGICFVGNVGIKEFLEYELGPQQPGPILLQTMHEDGPRASKVVGRHEGAIFYTIGQRHGLNVGGGLPYYVTGKDMSKNEVYVTTDLTDSNLWRKELLLTDVHWINQPPMQERTLGIRTRYRAALVNCRIENKGTNLTVKLDEAVRAITPGQSAVFYDNDEVLGGGIVS